MADILLRETVAAVRGCLGGDLDEMTVERAILGLFFTGVKLNDEHGGISFTPVKEIPQAVCCPSSAREMPLSGRLRGRPATAFLEDLFCGNVLRETLGVAVLNALSATCWDRMPSKPYALSLGRDAFDDVALPGGGLTVVVGALVPMLKRLRAESVDFRVLEQDPRTLKEHEMPHYVPAERASEVVPRADLLVVTGTTVLNGSLSGLLAMAKPDARIVVAGPTASMLPDAFFDRGVDVLGGILVTRPDELLDLLAEGGSGYHFFGRSAERMVIRRAGLAEEGPAV